MDKLTVTFKTVTPLFLGGAEPGKTAELRAPSIKGALRFWYRAVDPEYNMLWDGKEGSPSWEEKTSRSEKTSSPVGTLKTGTCPVNVTVKDKKTDTVDGHD